VNRAWNGDATVLVVEDDPSFRLALCDAIRSRGFRVVEAVSAAECLDAIDRPRPCVVVLDLGLPDMDGIALIRRLKDDPERNHIPIVAMTAAGDESTEPRVLSAGGAAFVRKPPNLVDLLGLLQNLCA